MRSAKEEAFPNPPNDELLRRVEDRNSDSHLLFYRLLVEIAGHHCVLDSDSGRVKERHLAILDPPRLTSADDFAKITVDLSGGESTGLDREGAFPPGDGVWSVIRHHLASAEDF